MKILVVMMAMVVGLIAAPVSANHVSPSDTVSATVEPGLIAVTVTKGNLDYSLVEFSTSTTLSRAEPTSQSCSGSSGPAFTAKNTGTLTADFLIKGGPSAGVISTGTISGSYADGGSGLKTTVTSTAHGLTTGNIVFISGTANYNGVFSVTVLTNDTFDITATFVAGTAEANAAWVQIGSPGSGGSGWDLVIPSAVKTTDDAYGHQFTNQPT